MGTSNPTESSLYSQQLDSWEINSSSSGTPEEIKRLTEPTPETVKICKRKIEVVIPKLRRIYIPKTECIAFSSSDEVSIVEPQKIASELKANPIKTVPFKRPNSHRLQAPKIAPPKKKARKPKLIISSEDDASSQEEDQPYDSSSKSSENENEEEADSDVILATRARTLRPKRINKFKQEVLKTKQRKSGREDSESDSFHADSLASSPNHENIDDFHEYSDSIVDDSNFVVNGSSDEGNIGMELLPEFFSRELGFRKQFDIFIEVLIRVSLVKNYLNGLDNDSVTYRGYRDVLTKTRGYCLDLASKRNWLSRFKDSLFACPNFSQEELFSADQSSGHTEVSKTSILLDGKLYDVDTLQSHPEKGSCDELGGRFSIPAKDIQIAQLCHRLYHFHYDTLMDIKRISKEVKWKSDDSDSKANALLRHLNKNRLIKKWYGRLERLLNDSAHETSKA